MGAVICSRNGRRIAAVNGHALRTTRHRLSMTLPDIGRDLVMHVASADERNFAGLKSVEIAMLRSVWSVTIGEKPDFGTTVSLDIFREYPSGLRFFDLSGTPWRDVKKDPRLLEHAINFPHFIGDIVDEANMSENVLHLARRVAESHVGIAQKHPDIFFPDLWNAFAASAVKEIMKSVRDLSLYSPSISSTNIECIWNIVLLEAVQAMKRYFWRLHPIHDEEQAAALRTCLKTPPTV